MTRAPVNAAPNLDPVEVAKYVASLAMSPALANIVGPYAIIFLAGVLGAAVALANRDPMDRGQSFYFFARAVGASMLLTVPVATVVTVYFDSWEAQWLFIPGAFALAYASDKYKSIFSFFTEQARVLISNWVNNKGQEK